MILYNGVRQQSFCLSYMKWHDQNPQIEGAIEAKCEHTGGVYVIVGKDLSWLNPETGKMENIPVYPTETPKESAEFHRNERFKKL